MDTLEEQIPSFEDNRPHHPLTQTTASENQSRRLVGLGLLGFQNARIPQLRGPKSVSTIIVPKYTNTQIQKHSRKSKSTLLSARSFSFSPSTISTSYFSGIGDPVPVMKSPSLPRDIERALKLRLRDEIAGKGEAKESTFNYLIDTFTSWGKGNNTSEDKLSADDDDYNFVTPRPSVRKYNGPFPDPIIPGAPPNSRNPSLLPENVIVTYLENGSQNQLSSTVLCTSYPDQASRLPLTLHDGGETRESVTIDMKASNEGHLYGPMAQGHTNRDRDRDRTSEKQDQEAVKREEDECAKSKCARHALLFERPTSPMQIASSFKQKVSAKTIGNNRTQGSSSVSIPKDLGSTWTPVGFKGSADVMDMNGATNRGLNESVTASELECDYIPSPDLNETEVLQALINDGPCDEQDLFAFGSEIAPNGRGGERNGNNVMEVRLSRSRSPVDTIETVFGPRDPVQGFMERMETREYKYLYTKLKQTITPLKESSSSPTLKNNPSVNLIDPVHPSSTGPISAPFPSFDHVSTMVQEEGYFQENVGGMTYPGTVTMASSAQSTTTWDDVPNHQHQETKGADTPEEGQEVNVDEDSEYKESREERERIIKTVRMSPILMRAKDSFLLARVASQRRKNCRKGATTALEEDEDAANVGLGLDLGVLGDGVDDNSPLLMLPDSREHTKSGEISWTSMPSEGDRNGSRTFDLGMETPPSPSPFQPTGRACLLLTRVHGNNTSTEQFEAPDTPVLMPATMCVSSSMESGDKVSPLQLSNDTPLFEKAVMREGYTKKDGGGNKRERDVSMFAYIWIHYVMQ